MLIIAIIAAVLFVVTFVTKRRYGVMALGLAAGTVLASAWAVNLAAELSQDGLTIPGIGSLSLAAALLIVAPALLLSIGGPAYKKHLQSVIAAAAVAILGALLCLGFVSLDAGSKVGALGGLTQFASTNQPSLVAIGVAIAVIDMVLTSKSAPHRSKH